MGDNLDITMLIMDDHEWFRREFARLDDAAGVAELSAIWTGLATRLEVHARAEETVFYPALLKKGDDAEGETDDAIRDHNKIRDAITEAARHEVGSEDWFDAVGRARSENTEHLGEEEDEGLPDFRKSASREMRARLGELWVQFYEQHGGGRGVGTEKVDPDEYVERHS